MTLKIATVQFSIKPNDPDYNMMRMETFIQKAAKEQCGLIIFPEDSVTGPLEGQVGHAYRSLEFFTFFQKLAFSYSIDIVPGSWALPENGLLYNTAYYFNSNGTLAGEYRKISLWDTEKAIITPGIYNDVFPTRFGLTGLGICWDMAFPELFKEMGNKGARLIIVPAYWSHTKLGQPSPENKIIDKALVHSLCVARAIENNITLVFCNAAGEYKNDYVHSVLLGHSKVTISTGIQVESNGNGEEILYFHHS
jgi:predicted amidohydrolase